MPSEVLLAAGISRSHDVAGVGSEVEKRVLEDLASLVTGGELSHGIMHVLILLVFNLQGHDGQAIKEKDEIDLLVGLAKVEVRAGR